jgi:hypothetical protein
MTAIRKIISGGQTGVDRAALDAAIERGITGGGWCPKGRASEQGPIPDHYPLIETPLADPTQRTEWNVRDADATLIIAQGKLTGGAALTQRLATSLPKPSLVIDPAEATSTATVRAWLNEYAVRTLNVAGPRASTDPQIYELALGLLRKALAGDAER